MYSRYYTNIITYQRKAYRKAVIMQITIAAILKELDVSNNFFLRSSENLNLLTYNMLKELAF